MIGFQKKSIKVDDTIFFDHHILVFEELYHEFCWIEMLFTGESPPTTPTSDLLFDE